MFDFCSLSYINIMDVVTQRWFCAFLGLRIHVSRAVKDALTAATGFEMEPRGLTKVKVCYVLSLLIVCLK